MNVSQSGIRFIKATRGFQPKAYLNASGLWTIGYGHKKNIEAGDVITPEEAEILLHQDIKACSVIVNSAVNIPLTQNQFDALVSLTLDIGAGKRGISSGLVELRSGQPSTLLMFLNQGCYAAAAEQFGSWIYVNNILVKELIYRRECEKNIFSQSKSSIFKSWFIFIRFML